MSLNAKQLSSDMLAAVKPVLQAHWGKAAPYATAEIQKLAICAAQIEAGYKSGEITAEEAGILRDMQASAWRSQRSKRSVSSPRKMPSMPHSKFSRPLSTKPSASRFCDPPRLRCFGGHDQKDPLEKNQHVTQVQLGLQTSQ